MGPIGSATFPDGSLPLFPSALPFPSALFAPFLFLSAFPLSLHFGSDSSRFTTFIPAHFSRSLFHRLSRHQLTRPRLFCRIHAFSVFSEPHFAQISANLLNYYLRRNAYC